MVLFRITILLIFSKPKPRDPFATDDTSATPISKKSKKSKSKTEKDKKSKKSKKSSEKKSKVGKAKNLPKEDYVVELGKPVAYAHVDYELIPNKVKYQCDIVCWNEAVKVFTADGDKIYKTVSDEDKIYAYITLEHNLKALYDDDIINMQTRVIKFNISTKKNKLKPSARSDKTKLLYIRKEDVHADYFVEAFTENPNIEESLNVEQLKKLEIEKFVQDLLMTCIRSPTTHEVVSSLNYEDELHGDIVKNIVKGTQNKLEVQIKEYTQVIAKKKAKAKAKGKKEKNTKNKKTKGKSKTGTSTKKSVSTSSKSKQSSRSSGKSGGSDKAKKGNPHFLVPASVFITDSDVALYQLKNCSNIIQDGFLILTCDSPLTNGQKYFFNPFIFKILKLERFPVEFAAKQGFEEIYAYCKIPDVCEIKTASKEITEKIMFNESYLQFISDEIDTTLYQFIQAQHLIIEIWGIKSSQYQRTPGHIFSTEKEDKTLSKMISHKNCLIRLKELEPKSPELLSIAFFDISSLLKRSIACKSREQCHQPNPAVYCNFPHKIKCEFSDAININELNLSTLYPQKGNIPEFQFSQRCTTLQISVELMVPQFANIQLHKCVDTYKRIYMVIFDSKMATLLLNEILQYNQEITGMEYAVACARKNSYKSEEDEEATALALTGFVIDNYKEFVFFVEGPSNGYILNIWNQVHLLDPNVASVFLNTDQVFDMRLYSQFLQYEPLYVITLKIPLQEMFSITWSFLRGHTPPPCYQAISKLHLLLNASSLKGMLQYNLFPTSCELMSFGAEFGVPLRWKGFRGKHNTTSDESLDG